MSEERIFSALSKPKLIKNNFDNERLKRLEKISINQDINFLNQKWEIRKSLYEIENKKNLSTQKFKEIEESLSKLKNYYDYDDAEYIEIRDLVNLFNQSTNEDYYKPIKTKRAFNGN